MRKTALLVVMLGVGVQGCTSDAGTPAGIAGPSMVRAAQPKLVPFRLTTHEGSSTGAPGGRCGAFPMITVQIEARGHATHLGQTSIRQSHCQNAFDPTGAFTDGEFTDTGADGSAIVGTYQGRLLPTDNPALFVIDGLFTITGGTRRFVGASGGGTARGEFDASTGQSSLTLIGQISSVGSLRMP